ncbi:RNA polymerase II-associated, partial [Apiosordaria backusii]
MSQRDKNYQQDYITRIRYSNALPPPPIPPKLLAIPSVGLASGQYTNPNFASHLARIQALNIEADGELGMPLDLVGMPGVFDGDESSIQAPSEPPPIHPHDRALLRPLGSLGKPKSQSQGVSFLRRTEYISNTPTVSRPKADPFLRPSASSAAARRPIKRKASPEPDKGTPAWIKRRIEKSFEAAAVGLIDRTKVKHPSKRTNCTIVDSFPLLPDLEAFPDSGAYVTVKFQTNPVTATDFYDTRMLSGILKPITRSQAEDDAYQQAYEAWTRNPDHTPKPLQMMNYDFYLPQDIKTGEKFRQKFDVDNPDKDKESLYTSTDTIRGDGHGVFKFPRVRAYETATEKEMDHHTKYSEEVILAYRNDERQSKGRTDDSAQKGVYYYPVMQRTTIRNQRTKNIARTIGVLPQGEEEEARVGELEVTVAEPGEELKAELERFKAMPVGYFGGEDEEEEEGEADH